MHATRGVTPQERLENLLALDLAPGPLLILTHDNPDPDSIASAAALQYLLGKTRGVKSTVAHGGIVGRAENRAMVRLLGIHLHTIPGDTSLDLFRHIALIDAQPFTGNSQTLPDGSAIDVVIDHHPLRSSTHSARFFDVRDDIGASATILTEYLRAAEIDIPSELATALLYGIRSETQDLGREASESDREAYDFLFHRSDLAKLSAIARPVLERRYYLQMAEALESIHLAGELAVCPLGDIIDPDFVPELADLTVRMEGLRWVLVYGHFEDRVYVSIRTNDHEANAGEVMQQLLDGLGRGGGHGMRAGGAISSATVGLSRERLSSELNQRFLELMDAKGVDIVPLRQASAES